MPFFEFFRNLFGNGSTQEPPQYRFENDQRYRDSFRNPIWQTDEDEDDVSDFSNQQPRTRYQFRIFSDPFEMTRFFETQMDDMMRNFFSGFGIGNNESIFGPFDHDFTNTLPNSDENASPKGPLDEVLKPSYDRPDSKFGFDDFFNGLPMLDQMPHNNPHEKVLKPSYEMPNSINEKLDSDIDGKLKSDELTKIWKPPSTSQKIEGSSQPFSIRTFGSSVSTQIVRRPDGSVEERRTVRDSDGNEEIKITRQIGDKVHTIITQKSKDGSETKKEDIVNMDENELKGFDEKWTKIQTPPRQNQGDEFPWYKFFGPNPKL